MGEIEQDTGLILAVLAVFVILLVSICKTMDMGSEKDVPEQSHSSYTVVPVGMDSEGPNVITINGHKFSIQLREIEEGE